MTLAPDARVAVVGAGLGGVTVVRQLRAGGHRGPVTLLGRERHAPYDRPPLSKAALRDGTVPPPLVPADERLDADLRLGCTAVGLDGTTVLLADGTRVPADAVVLAPGATPRRLPVLAGHPRAHVLRTRDDAAALRADVLAAGTLVVVGAGFLGLEAAATARALGADVEVVELLDAPLARAVGPQVSAAVAARATDLGVRLRTSTSVAGVEDDALVLSDDGRLPAAVVLEALGVLPDTGWTTGLETTEDGGLRCDERGRTSRPGVWAVGDAAAWRTGDGWRRVEHWTSALEQGAAVAAAMTGAPAPEPGVPYVWSEQGGLLLQALGEVTPSTETGLHPAGDGAVALHVADGVVVGVVLLDARRLAGRARRLLRGRPAPDEVLAALLR